MSSPNLASSRLEAYHTAVPSRHDPAEKPQASAKECEVGQKGVRNAELRLPREWRRIGRIVDDFEGHPVKDFVNVDSTVLQVKARLKSAQYSHLAISRDLTCIEAVSSRAA